MGEMNKCQQVISLHGLHSVEKVRSFQPPWIKVNVYVCPTCKARHRVQVNWLGRIPGGGFKCNAMLKK